MRETSTSGWRRVRRKRVLVVDHDSDAAELYAIWLRRAGHRALIAADAPRATVVAPPLRPDVAVIHIELPGMDGFELLRALREVPELAFCRFLAVTANLDPTLKKRCLASGFSACFEQPLLRSELVDSVFSTS